MWIKLKRFLFVTIFLLLASPLWAATYFIDWTLGDDTRTNVQAQSKSTPWQRIPYMQGWGGAGNGYSHTAGDRFIFKGGETWPASCFGFSVTAGGSSDSVRDYIGVDATWYSGGSWSRPIWTCGNAECAGDGGMMGFGNSVSYVTLDNIEMTGLYWDTAPYPLYMSLNAASYITISNVYCHGWSHSAGASDSFACINGASGHDNNAGSIIDNLTCSGADVSGRNSGYCIRYGGPVIRNSTFEYVANGIITYSSQVYNNTVHDIADSFDPAAHGNAIEMWGSGNIYNNFVYNVDSAQVLLLYPDGDTINVFNNVIYGISNFNGQNIVFSYEGQTDYGGAATVYNNTIVPQSGLGCIHTQLHLSSLIVENNHCISTGNFITNTYAPTYYDAGTHNLTQTPTVANGQGYVVGNVYAPTTGGSTIDQGETIALFSTDILAVSRPQGASWDIGAYEYGSGDTTAPVVTITVPTSEVTYTTSSSPFYLGGTASDATGVTAVTYSNSLGGSGSCTGTTTWSCPAITMTVGGNVITITATDAASNNGTDLITVTYVKKKTLFRR